MPKPRLFVDLDGVMFDFDSHFKECFNLEPPYKGGTTDDEMWALIYDHGSFFRTMPLFDGARDFWKQILDMGFDPIILTAASKTHYVDVATQKRAAVREKITTNHLMLPVYGGAAKTLFMHAPNDILIDDWHKNCTRWANAGGVAIYHEGDYEDTLLRLGLILTAPTYR